MKRFMDDIDIPEIVQVTTQPTLGQVQHIVQTMCGWHK